MSNRITRREFLKLTGLGTVASALSLSSTGELHPHAAPALKGIPGLNQDTLDNLIPTTCSECSAGCGILVRMGDGYVQELVGNPEHPLSYGQLCSRAYDHLDAGALTEKLPGPLSRRESGSGFDPIDWTAAADVVANALHRYRPIEIAFLVGLYPDHFYDLLKRLSLSLGGLSLLRYSTQSEFEARLTLMDAVQKAFGISSLPYFDLANAQVIFSFGANFLEDWLSPAAYSQRFQLARQSGDGYLVQFEPRKSLTAASADEWVRINPGSEAYLARALASLVPRSEPRDGLLSGSKVNLLEVAALSGVPVDEINRLAGIFNRASRKVALPGSVPLGNTNGLSAASAIMDLNIQAQTLGCPGGVYLLPDVPVHADLVDRPSTFAEVGSLVERIKSGRIKALFVHGTDPLAELPKALGVRQALDQLELLVSFSPYWNETARVAHHILPDQIPLASWGYQKVKTGSDRLVISALQPVMPPDNGVRSSVNVLLQAVQRAGGELAESLSYPDEVSFIRASILDLINQGGAYTADDHEAFWRQWLDHGGWWTTAPCLMPPVALHAGGQVSGYETVQFESIDQSNQLHLLAYFTAAQERDIGEGQGGRLVRAELHPATAWEQGVKDGDLVIISSPAGEIEALVHVTDAVVPGSLALPIMDIRNQDRTREPASNPLNLLLMQENQSGNLATSATLVRISRVDV